MSDVTTARRVNLVILVLGVIGALLLLVQQIPVWLRILPLVAVFAYPLVRMARSRRSERGG